ncbi:helix-turn-helix transcriptional regulator [Roseibium sp.]|uniref:helix-turn-helix domain-containing protein n=1 Tax=Roseibium sp. TaxID=1936156 RepID=UPI0032656DE8
MTGKLWDKHAIKAELHRQGMTLTALAEREGINPKSFRGVWARTHRKAEAALARFLGEPVEVLFPDRYPIRTSRILSTKYEAESASPKKCSECSSSGTAATKAA